MMRRAIGVLLVTLSIAAVGQSLWELFLWERGASRWAEAMVQERPHIFAAHRFDVRDDQPSDGSHSQAGRAGAVELVLDGRPLGARARAMVRPGLSDLGRYHRWIDVWQFRDRATGDRSLWITRRLQPTDGARPRFEVFVIGSNGSVDRRVYRTWQLGFDYRRFRATQFIRDGTSAAVPLSVLEGAFFPPVWLVFPIGTLVLGLVMVRGRRARTTP